MQKTDFDFEVWIHEDASTDHTADIIREYEERYPDLFHVIYEEENQYHKGIEYNHDLLAPLARGKYVALCEGDDAWVDDRKLQMQVDYMESHPECSLTIHKAYAQYPSAWTGNRSKRTIGYNDEGVVNFRDLFNCWEAPTSSFMFRMDDYIPMPKFFREAPTGDDPLKYYLGSRGQVYYFNRVMSVHNKMTLGSWSSEFEKWDFEKRKAHCLGYIKFYELYDIYTDYMNHDLMIWCMKERLKWITGWILENYSDFQEWDARLESMENDCIESFKKYIQNVREKFSSLNENNWPQLYGEQIKNRNVYIYGAGLFAKRDIIKMKHCGIKVSGIIVSTGKDEGSTWNGYPVECLDAFAAREKNDYIIFISMGENYAYEVIKNLKEKMINNYVWLYEKIYGET